MADSLLGVELGDSSQAQNLVYFYSNVSLNRLNLIPIPLPGGQLATMKSDVQWDHGGHCPRSPRLTITSCSHAVLAGVALLFESGIVLGDGLVEAVVLGDGLVEAVVLGDGLVEAVTLSLSEACYARKRRQVPSLLKVT